MSNAVMIPRHAIFVFLLLLISPAQADSGRSLPIPPTELMASMPQALPVSGGHWALKRSMGFTDYQAPWLMTTVLRDWTFVSDPPPDSQVPPAKPAPAKTISIQIQDTGLDPTANAFFRVNPAQKSDPNRQTFQGFPIYVFKTATSEIVSMQVAGRYIVNITAVNGETKDYEKWLAAVNTAKLATEPMNPADQIHRPFKRIVYDELNPAKNSVTDGTFTTPAEAADDMAKMRAKQYGPPPPETP